MAHIKLKDLINKLEEETPTQIRGHYTKKPFKFSKEVANRRVLSIGTGFLNYDAILLIEIEDIIED